MSGIIAWARREEWRHALAERIERHAGAACAAAGIEMSEIETLLGEHGASTVWGAAFEDLLALDMPDGRNLAEEYLRRRGWKESASTRDYIAALRHARIGLYEVTALQPGAWMRLRDLIGGGEAVQVMERSGSRGMRLGPPGYAGCPVEMGAAPVPATPLAPIPIPAPFPAVERPAIAAPPRRQPSRTHPVSTRRAAARRLPGS